MNVQHLRYFLTVMETGSLSRAAEALGVTQPTLSVALRRLEQEFGTRLFVPSGRGITPLPSARRLEEKVRPAVRALSDVRRELNGASTSGLKIGLLQSLADEWLSKLVNAWEGPVEVVEALADELEKQVANGTVDIALTVLTSQAGLSHKVLLREPYMLFVGSMHMFAGRRSVSLAELDQQPFVLRQCCEKLGTGRRLLKEARIRFRVVAKTRQEATAGALVASGIGCTLAPRSWHRPGTQAIPVVGLPLERTIAMVWKESAGSGMAASLARKLEAQAAGMPVGKRA